MPSAHKEILNQDNINDSDTLCQIQQGYISQLSTIFDPIGSCTMETHKPNYKWKIWTMSAKMCKTIAQAIVCDMKIVIAQIKARSPRKKLDPSRYEEAELPPLLIP